MGKTIMNHLCHFNPIENTCIDYMHSLLEGVVKGMFRLWFGQDNVLSDLDNNGKRKRVKHFESFITNSKIQLKKIQLTSNQFIFRTFLS